MRRIKKIFDLKGSLMVLITGVLAIGCASSGKKEMTPEEKARMYIELGNASLLDGDPTGALVSLKEAEAIDPDIPELNHCLALVFYHKHDLNLARQYAEKSVKNKPNYSNANITLGKIYIDLGMLHQARAPLLQAAQDPLNREGYKAWTNLGILEEKLSNWSAAEDMYSRAIQAAPLLSCVAHYNRGKIKSQKKLHAEAIQDYALASDKFCVKFGDAFLALGQAYQQVRRYDEARKTYLELMKRFPNTPVAAQAMEQLRFLP